MTMKNKERLECLLSFTTPAFLGGPDQAAEWRTPPLKALIRQWWRVAHCHGKAVPPAELRAREGELFGRAGMASGENGGARGESAGPRVSRVRIRLESWHGRIANAGDWQKSKFGSVGSGGSTVAADLYLGYGPIQLQGKRGRGTVGPERTFIPPGPDAARRLSVAYPSDERADLLNALRLVQAFGTVGSRSRNGWGSVELRATESTAPPLSPEALARMVDEGNADSREWLRLFARPWKDALDFDWTAGAGNGADWCHALGSDERGLLLWKTKIHKRWEEVITQLAKVRKEMRAVADSSGHGGISERALLAYPVTRHTVAAWGNNARSANQVMFKVVRLDDTRCVGLVVHLPHALPQPLAQGLIKRAGGNGTALMPELRRLELSTWSKVHRKLDELLDRLP